VKMREIVFDETNWRVEKMLSLEAARKKAAELKQAGNKLVTVNGSFDILHAGHLDQLEEAKQQGDVLFVGVNSDKSVSDEKGENRPLISERARAAMLAALQAVDYVTIVDEGYDTVPDVLIKIVKSDVHVNGPDYGEPDTWREWPVMREVGAQGYVVKKRNDISTSEILDQAINTAPRG